MYDVKTYCRDSKMSSELIYFSVYYAVVQNVLKKTYFFAAMSKHSDTCNMNYMRMCYSLEVENRVEIFVPILAQMVILLKVGEDARLMGLVKPQLMYALETTLLKLHLMSKKNRLLLLFSLNGRHFLFHYFKVFHVIHTHHIVLCYLVFMYCRT